MADTDLFWWLANTRYQMYENRLLAGAPVPSGDPILDGNRFTNTFRAADRVSQRLIRIQLDTPQVPEPLVMRTLLFKVFNKEETWDYLDRQGLTVGWDPQGIKDSLDHYEGVKFSSAYKMVNPMMGSQVKHHFYVDLLDSIQNRHMGGILRAGSMEELITCLLDVPGLGPFLSYQYAIDLNYAGLFGFSENAAVVAGPGAVRGMKKIFGSARLPAEKIRQLHEEAEERGPWLLGKRPMHLIDVQNMLCEYDKYTRVAHEGRRMRQRYRVDPRPLPDPVWPRDWGI